MRIYVTAPGRFGGDALKVGRYNVEPADTGTSAQNAAFHALCYEYWISGCFSYNANTPGDLKEAVKYYHGAGLWWTVGADGGETLEMKSWGHYTLRERQKTIDGLIREMDTAGVDSKKYREILRGMKEGEAAMVCKALAETKRAETCDGRAIARPAVGAESLALEAMGA